MYWWSSSKKSICFALILIMVVVTVISACSQPSPAPTAAWKPSGIVVLGDGGASSVGYVSGIAMAKGITEKTGVEFKMIAGEKASERARILKENVASFVWFPATYSLAALQGILEWQDWGPQSVRTVWNGGVLELGMATRADSGIKTIYDIKGKKVASFPGSLVEHKYYMEPALAFANLTWSDVVETPMQSYDAAGQAILEGAADVTFLATTSSLTYEIESSVHGIQWLALPVSDTAGWARYNAVNPAHFPATAKVGGGISETKPLETFGYNYQVLAYDWQDENLVYWWIKQVAETYDTWKDNHAYLPKWTLDHALDYKTWFVPWHEGSVKYFKDIGRWTSDMEKKQQELLSKYPQKMTK